jgi:hypothetical protein
MTHRPLRLVACLAALAPALGVVPAFAYPGIGGIIAHSRDDIPGAFSTLSGDDATASATLPFSVVIDGTSYTTVVISTNGWLEFGSNTSGNSDPTNACLPTSKHTNPFFAFFWDNMRTINTAVRYGTVGTSPGRVFIVDADIEAVAGASHDVTMQVQIHEGSNLITVKYDDTEAESSGQSATIGYQGAGGSGATARGITCNGKVLDDNTPLDGWSIDLGLPQGTALSGFTLSSSDDIPGTFTTLSGDDVTANATLPFSVVIDGTSYTAITISTNGWLEFGGNTSGNSDPTNDCLPSSAHTNPLLAMYWDDMRTINTAMRYGTVGTSPNRTFIIDADVENNNAGNNDTYWQLQIHEGGLVTVKYVGSQNEANGQTATIGFQSAGGASATARSIGCNAKVMDDNLPDEGWSIDLGSPHGSALLGVLDSSRDDLPGTFTSLTGNDSVATASLGFTATLEGVGYTTVAISTNGWLEFGGNTSGGAGATNTCLPSSAHTNPFLAAYWDDMRTLGSAVRYGTLGSAGGRVFIADFELENNFGSNHNLTMQVQVHERSSAITVKYLDSENEANGQTATIGYQTAGGASATVRSITCNGKVLDDNTARGEGWSVAQVDVCGDALIGPGEVCDLGTANGQSTSCCTSACAFRASGSTCRSAAGVCDVAETCSGASATCPANGFASSTTVCRSSAGECDVAESCTGSSASCPADAKVPGGTGCTPDGNPCSLDQCDGTNNGCQHPAGNAGALCRSAAGVCDVAETCTGASTSCPADGFDAVTVCRSSAGECDLAEQCDGTGPDCPADAKAPGGTGCGSDGNPCTVDACDGASDACQHPAGNAGAVCRPFAGVCDLAETCTGSDVDCPADDFLTSATVCRSATGVCDVAEHCTGSSATCPADALATSGTQCRAAADLCDVAETCTGSSASCPSDALAASGTPCRPAAGDCDVAEACTGTSEACPADAFVSGGTECRAAAGDCDVAEACTGSGPSCPSDSVAGAFVVCRPSVGPCDADDHCDGAAATCPSLDTKEPTTTVCRPAVGPCDAADFCDGVGDTCPPADLKEPNTTLCRTAAGICDAPDFCDGVGDTCPLDAKEPATTVCRSASGVCDLADTCTGSSDSCPPDAKQTAGTVCRSAAGVCDVADVCDGSSNACPSDAKAPSSTICRSQAGGCDVAETCTGSSNACPADGVTPSGTVCRPPSSDPCDVAESCDGSSAACPADTGNPDGDGDGTCDALDDCPTIADPGQADGDNDGTGDVCDPCTNVFNGGTFATKPKVVITKLLGATGDDKLKMKGFILVPTVPTIEPDLNGLRLLLQKQGGALVFDVTLPAGTYSLVDRAGWKANGVRSKFTYKNSGNPTPLVAGIGKASIGVSSKTPGLVKFSIGGKNGTYAPIAQADLPIKATLVIDVPYATTGQCGETSFGPANCLLLSTGNTVRCFIK